MAEVPWGSILGAGALGLSAGIIVSLAVLRLPYFRGVPKMSTRPHPKWRPGQKQRPVFRHEDTIQIKTSELGPAELYPLTISAIVPRPIAFISSQSKAGVGNLSPYSYFNVLSHAPPILAVGHCWAKGKPKDSLANILETGEFVVSIISEWFVESANHTCGAYPFEVNEMERAALTPVPSMLVAPPRVGESALNMECKVVHTYDVKNGKGEVTVTIVLGEVLMFHIAKDVATRTPNSGKVIVDPFKLKPVSRFGGNIYGTMASLFEIPRPDGEGRYPGDDAFTQSDRDKLINKKKV